jgi:hypothetical protein
MPQNSKPIQLPLASYQLPDLRASAKLLIGCYPEPVQQDGNAGSSVGGQIISFDDKDGQAAVLRSWPGITAFSAIGPVRGYWEMAGQVYVVAGSTLYMLSAAGNAVAVIGSAGTLSGNSFVRMTDNGACLVVLVPGTDICYTYTPFTGGGGYQPLTNAFFLGLGGAIDCWFVDTYIVFLANNNGGQGSYTFFNDDGRQFSGPAQISFTTAASVSRQFGTDPFYGMCIDHREALFFGSRTTEGYVDTGNPIGSPFTSAPDTYMPYGMHPSCAYSIALQDNSPFWVCNDLTVRRRQGQTPVRVSNPYIEYQLAIANQNGLLLGCYAMAPTWNGHPFYVLTVPLMQMTFVYDCVTQQWFNLVSVVAGQEVQWQALSYYNAFGLQLIGSSGAGGVGYLDPTTQMEFGTSPVVRAFTMQPIYTMNDRIVTRRIELVMTAGGGPTPAVAPKVDLLLSDNWGQSYYSAGDQGQTLGVPGDTENRAVWWNCGQHRSLVPQFRVTDATPTFTVDVHAVIEPGTY